MPKKIVKSIQIKLLTAIGLSAGTAGILTYILYQLAMRIYDSSTAIRRILQAVRLALGDVTIAAFAGLLLFVIIFFLVTRKSVNRIEGIIAAVKRMEHGDLDARIEVTSKDEIGELASAINNMAGKLRNSMEEERQAEQIKRDLITSVSHDLRTPLTSIIGFQGLLMDRSHHSDGDLERFAVIAHKKALWLQAQIDELFEYTKVSFGGLRLQKRSIDLNELAGQLVEEMYPVFEQAGMQCRLNAPNERLDMQADGELLHRLIENLLNNAVKYGSDGKFVDVSLQKSGLIYEMKVANYGPPIPKEELNNIFKWFYRVEQSRSRKSGGTGLGLAIAANIAELHNGTITAESDTGKTCFTVRLPADSLTRS